MGDQATENLSLDQVRELANEVFRACGVSDEACVVLADIVTRSERDGPRSHGLRMLPVYAQSFTSGYANPEAKPVITRTASGALQGDADNGYYQHAASLAHDQLIEMARENGIAAFSCKNCHHLAGLRFDVEPLAEAGLVAIGVINSLSMVVPQGGTRPVFGTNPMAFACPREGQAPIVWDQASSMVALMDIRMAAAEGHPLPYPAGLAPDGSKTIDPNAILDTRSLLPFGEHKGAAIAFLVEVLGAALAGGTLSVDNQDREAHGALNIKGGSTVIAIDPNRFGNPMFNEYINRISAEITDNGDARIPGDGRLKMRTRAMQDGVNVATDVLDQIRDVIKTAGS
ncbi:Ldh family oxidoreductase [Halocynthiibacter styelae]|uniref:Ldh family oxidoreductase n=1 Tax=Halocynthiibacter styelae TaxID=2761955 RepID=A0A8J7IZ63_9RHOB|nr:Ldh family oxidoreductase [Paenihalocynthiibacter styelae]MBI1495025.1 Ldh family oxidoreductase [Paenihalocynthiibacter styelae]